MRSKPALRHLPLWTRVLTALAMTGLFAALLNDFAIARNASARLYYLAEETPECQVGLLLGTSKYAEGHVNQYYRARIEAAAELFHAGRVRAILVSGDASTQYYDETTTMQRDLVELGVPEDFIMLDYAGVRTLDSVFRAKKVFGLDRVIVVSQQFHCERALYLADAVDLDATGFCAEDTPYTQSLLVRSRETLARAMAFVDLNIFGTQPRSLELDERARRASR